MPLFAKKSRISKLAFPKEDDEKDVKNGGSYSSRAAQSVSRTADASGTPALQDYDLRIGAFEGTPLNASGATAPQGVIDKGFGAGHCSPQIANGASAPQKEKEKDISEKTHVGGTFGTPPCASGATAPQGVSENPNEVQNRAVAPLA